MNLSMNGMKDRGSWERAGIVLPGYDVERVSAKAKNAYGCILKSEIFSVCL